MGYGLGLMPSVLSGPYSGIFKGDNFGRENMGTRRRVGIMWRVRVRTMEKG